MQATKAVALSISGLISLGTPMTAGAYYKTKESIWDQIRDDAMPGDIEESTWKELNKKIPEISDPKDQDLKNLKSNYNADENGVKLKEWCKRIYKKDFKNIFWSGNSNLLEDAKKACILPIEVKIESTKKFTFSESSTTNKDEFTKKLTTLEQSEAELDQKLKTIKQNKTSEEKWSLLENYCKEIYKKGYQGKDSQRWKLTEIYCTKQSPA